MNKSYLKNATLLYVEDDESIRNILERRLRAKVKNLYVAYDGEEGLAKYKEFKPDIILTDISMPNMNGIQMSRQIKAIDKNIPIIISSAHGDTKYLLDAITLGINGYLLKPIDKVKLFDTLEENIKVKFLEKELNEQRNKMLQQSRFALLGEMISMIAHQWRQPLNVISMSIGNLRVKFALDKYELETKKGREELPSKIEEDFVKIDDRLQVLSSIINDFATFYKPRDIIETMHINSTLQEAVRDFSKSLQFGNIKINEQYNSHKNILLYKDVFLQICMNLLNNANETFIQKDVENPQINISTNDYDDGVELSIEDNAGGISEEILDKIFNPYFSTKAGKNGLGLGLYMSKLVIEEHLNGEINVFNIDNGIKITIKFKEIKQG